MVYSKYLFYLCTQQKYVINISQTTIASIISYKHITMAFNWPTIIRKSHHHVYTVIHFEFYHKLQSWYKHRKEWLTITLQLPKLLDLLTLNCIFIAIKFLHNDNEMNRNKASKFNTKLLSEKVLLVFKWFAWDNSFDRMISYVLILQMRGV